MKKGKKMNRRTFLMSSLAAIGTGLFLSKEGKASSERKLVTLAYVWGHYRAGKVTRRWISKEYLIGKDYNIELSNGGNGYKFEKFKVKKNFMIFVDIENKEKCMYKATAFKGFFRCVPKRNLL